VPGSLPDPATITLANVDGNHVVLDLGGGHYAFFAHLQKGSVTVEPGDRVHRGEVLGLLGNSGNTSAPHLHFHLMDGPSVLGSDGLPYTYDRLGLAGHVDRSLYTSSFEGDWGQGLLPQPQPQTDRFPLDLDVVDFPG
jgi:murein DD-endopeptidase MepM/ murein hydrolase activator NlpD